MFHQRPLFLTIAALTVFLSSGQALSAKNAGSQPSKRAPLKQLVPQQDLSIEPDPSEVFDQAVQQSAAGHMQQAEKLFAKVLDLDPTNADAHYNLGTIREWGNDLQGALDHYLQAAKLKPNDREISDAVTAVRFKIAHKPELDAQALRAKQAQDMDNHSELARQAFARQDYITAVKHLQPLVKTIPDDPKIQFALGQSLRALKSYEWAAYRLKMAIYLDPENELYRKTLVELDQEIQDAKQTAYRDAARMALQKTQPLVFPELAETGMKTRGY